MMPRLFLFLAVSLGALFVARVFFPPAKFVPPEGLPQLQGDDLPVEDDPTPLATFGSGCFWCTEAIFQELKGIESVTSGYSGGKLENPTYEAISTGRTGHAEVVQIRFDPKVISYAQLLEVFWLSHDPTTLNRQGADVGTQYRSVVFTHSETQRKLAEYYRKQLDSAGVYPDPIVTEITPYETFYPAEPYHQDFFDANPRQPYCRAVIVPKLEKLQELFQKSGLAKKNKAGQ